MFFPRVQDLRFGAEARFLRVMRLPFRAEFAGLRSLRLRDPLVVDIGCNRGISISTIRSMIPNARVIGYEANPDLAAATATRFEDDPRIEIRAVALGTAVEGATLYVPVYRGYRFDGLASFDRATARALFSGDLLYGFDPARLVIEERATSMRRLDDDALDPQVIKLYVQGHEVAVLEGARQTIVRCRPIIIAPSHHPGVDTLLRSLGFGRYQWTRGHFEAEVDSAYVVYYMTPDRFASLSRAA